MEFTANELIDIMGKNLNSLKGVLNSEDFDFNKSKKLVIESIDKIEKHLKNLNDILNKKK
jgi:hypothetical protein